MTETKTRTFIKTIIYRLWEILTTYLLLLIMGQSWDQALLPTIIINVVWMVAYYVYERIWNKIQWGRI